MTQFLDAGRYVTERDDPKDERAHHESSRLPHIGRPKSCRMSAESYGDPRQNRPLQYARS